VEAKILHFVQDDKKKDDKNKDDKKKDDKNKDDKKKDEMRFVILSVSEESLSCRLRSFTSFRMTIKR
jgi:hypothetical protein